MKSGIVRFLIACLGSFLVIAGNAAPVIKSQPAALTINAGSTASFSVIATNADPVTYQWQFKGTNLLGETNSSLLIENVSLTQAGAYRVIVSGSGAIVTSAAATLKVLQGTIVHFALATGTVDVELFDHDKPVTVQNFLHYYNNGLYADTFFHRLVPNFVLQGGGYASTNHSETPLVLTNFVDVKQLATYTINSWFLPVKNEFSAGPRVRNTYGTIAMARTPGNTNSATSQWFFNLADNSTNLDNVDGGFTVFGRVIKGTNVLNGFNSLSTNSGIVNLSSNWPTGLTNAPTYWPRSSGSFSEVPVQSGTAYPKNSDLFFAKITFSSKPIADRTAPTIKLISPSANSHITNGTFVVLGSASDNSGLSYQDFWIDFYTPQKQYLSELPMSGGTNWSVNVTNMTAGNTDLSPGPYLLIARAWDGYGNLREMDVPVYIPARLSVKIEGAGALSPNLDGKSLDPYNLYSMTATPSRGNLFVGWSGNGISSSSPKLTFTMGTNTVVTAKFATNYFPGALATYNGLFQPTNAPAATNSGSFTVSTTGTGGYSGNITLAGQILRFTGQFDYLGNSSVSLKVPSTTNSIALKMLIDLTNSTGTITGTVAGRGWTSQLLAYRKAAKLSAPLVAGKYVVTLQPDAAGALQPEGDGYLVNTLVSSGGASISGKLADGTALLSSSSVAAGGQLPLCISLYKGKGILIGWLNVTNAVSTLKWIRPASAGGAYADFISQLNTLTGAFSKPSAGTAYEGILDGGALAEPIRFGMTINSAGQWIVTGDLASQLKLLFSASSALISGKYAPTGNSPLVVSGAFVDSTRGGAGFFTNSAGLSGRFTVKPN